MEYTIKNELVGARLHPFTWWKLPIPKRRGRPATNEPQLFNCNEVRMSIPRQQERERPTNIEEFMNLNWTAVLVYCQVSQKYYSMYKTSPEMEYIINRDHHELIVSEELRHLNFSDTNKKIVQHDKMKAKFCHYVENASHTTRS